jgi:hypothetical protein
MIQGGTTEIIWHFMGYLHLTQELATAHPSLDGWVRHGSIADYKAPLTPSDTIVPDLEDLSSARTRVAFSEMPGRLAAPEHLKALHLDETSFPSHSVPLSLDWEPSGWIARPVEPVWPGQDPVHPPPSGPPPYEMTYSEGGDDKLIGASQTNLADDTDTLLSSSGTGVSSLHAIDVPLTLHEMLATAQSVTPDDLIPSEQSPLGWLNLVVQRDAARAGEGEDAHADHRVEPGRYVDGVRQADNAPADPTDHVTAQPPAWDPSSGPAQIVELGGNVSHNGAAIVDLDEATSRLIVLGDYYETNAIVQANVLTDDDQVSRTTADGVGIVVTDGNHATNIAAFVEKALDSGLKAGVPSGGLDVNVDVVDGDFYDVKSLVQRNWITDNDVAVQTRYDAYAEAHLGGDMQGNVARFVDWDHHYDVIVVLGNYHEANFIFQKNVLLDNDIVKTASEAQGDGAGQDVFTGNNALTNDAAITQYGATTFSPLTSDYSELARALAAHEDVDLSTWSQFAGSATGSLSVLVVTGDYYDINVLSQINVIADLDTAIQYLPGLDAEGVQWVSAGDNEATNVARIVDVGGLDDQYLGGTHYQDSLLYQANYVEGADTVLNGDTQTLVSEVIAFTGNVEAEAVHDPDPLVTDHGIHGDLLGGVLT